MQRDLRAPCTRSVRTENMQLKPWADTAFLRFFQNTWGNIICHLLWGCPCSKQSVFLGATSFQSFRLGFMVCCWGSSVLESAFLSRKRNLLAVCLCGRFLPGRFAARVLLVPSKEVTPSLHPCQVKTKQACFWRKPWVTLLFYYGLNHKPCRTCQEM